MKKLLQALKRDERGVSAVEYAILAGILLVIIVAGVTTFGDSIAGLFTDTAAAIDAARPDTDAFTGETAN